MKKSNSNLKKGLYLLIFLVILCLISINYTNSGIQSQGTEIISNNISLPRISGTEINITTPANTTYTAAMSGY